MTHTLPPVAPPGRRTALAGLALILAIAGAQVYATSGEGEGLQHVWPPILVVWWLPAALGVLLHRRRAQRWLCMLGAFLTGLVAIMLSIYGGIYQLPAVVALALAARTR